MSEPTYFILASLMDGPLYGYAIIKRAEMLSNGRVRLGAGTLYAALDRLVAARLIETARSEIVAGRARAYYSLSQAGLDSLRVESQRMIAAAKVVSRRTASGRTAGSSA